ncbi:ABC transporter permease [Celeribacter indicus]|uniref:ABC transporter n=1 Tax=Celeribacter indicus TaxID=1208324 RepID=A0A0B5E5D2_9RHOB|nr:ABC transporter permease subunit [Celeribacter indicus]AJE48600.1 ABC transporter [Celeribacter indicus]SDX09426.1 NitT/TauT family transport system permease protein [Celeribacter indicus]
MPDLPLTNAIGFTRNRDWVAAISARALSGTIALISILFIWHVMSIAFRPWVPAIDATLVAMIGALQSPAFWGDFFLTLGRVLASFAAASVAGAILGLFIGLNEKAEAFFQPLLALALAVPDPVYIIFAILAVGTGETAGFIALTVAVAPFVTNIVRSNVHARDKSLDEMAQIYHLPRGVRLRSVLVPQLMPALLTAMRFSFALSWKLVVVVEAIGQPDGIGASIFNSFRLLRMREVAAVAILFIIAMQLLERGVLGRVEKKLLRWRD